MPNTTLVYCTVTGDKDEVSRLLAHNLTQPTRVETHDVSGRPRTVATLHLNHLWADRYATIAEVARRFPNVVVTAASVELARGSADAHVYCGPDIVGSYDMPEAELTELLAGPDMHEEYVIDALFETVASYEDDALRKMDAATPSP